MGPYISALARMSSVFWWLNLVSSYSLYKILYPKRRVKSYSILGTIVSPNKILLIYAIAKNLVPLRHSIQKALNPKSYHIPPLLPCCFPILLDILLNPTWRSIVFIIYLVPEGITLVYLVTLIVSDNYSCYVGYKYNRPSTPHREPC